MSLAPWGLTTTFYELLRFAFVNLKTLFCYSREAKKLTQQQWCGNFSMLSLISNQIRLPFGTRAIWVKECKLPAKGNHINLESACVYARMCEFPIWFIARRFSMHRAYMDGRKIVMSMWLSYEIYLPSLAFLFAAFTSLTTSRLLLITTTFLCAGSSTEQ